MKRQMQSIAPIACLGACMGKSQSRRAKRVQSATPAHAERVCRSPCPRYSPQIARRPPKPQTSLVPHLLTAMQRLLTTARQFLPAAQRAGGLAELQRAAGGWVGSGGGDGGSHHLRELP